MTLIISLTLVTTGAYSAPLQCIQVYTKQISDTILADAVSEPQREQQLAAYTERLLVAIQHSIEQLPIDFYYSIKDHLKGLNGVTNSLEMVTISDKISSTLSPKQKSIAQILESIDTRSSSLEESIKDFEKSNRPRAGKAGKWEDSYHQIKSIKDLYDGLSFDLTHLKKEGPYLAQEKKSLSHSYSELATYEKNYARYLADFQKVYSPLLLNQHHYAGVSAKLASLGLHFRVEIQHAEGELAQLRALIRTVDVASQTVNLALSNIASADSLSINYLLVKYGFTPAVATDLLQTFESQNLQKIADQEKSRAKQIARAAAWTNWKKKLIAPVIALGVLGGGGTGYAIHNYNETAQLNQIRSTYEVQRTGLYSATSEQNQFMAKYKTAVPAELAEVVGQSTASTSVVSKYIKLLPKDFQLTPELFIFVVNYSPHFLKNESYDSFLKLTEIKFFLETFLRKPLSRSYTNQEKVDLIKSLELLKQSFSPYFKIQKQNNVGEELIKGSKSEIEIYLDSLLARQISVSDKILALERAREENNTQEKDRAVLLDQKQMLEREQESARIAQEARDLETITRLVEQGDRLSWADEKVFELWAEKKASPELKAIFQIKDASVLLRTLIAKINSSPNHGMGNADVLFILKNLTHVSAVNESHPDSFRLRDSLMSFHKKKYDSWTDKEELHYLAIYRLFESNPGFEKMNAVEAALMNKYIEANRDIWAKAVSGGSEKDTTSLIMATLSSKIKVVNPTVKGK